MTSNRAPRVQFGPFEADLHTGELYRCGVRVVLQHQSCLFLKALIERHGDLVTRDDLRRLLWDDTTFVGFDRGLTSAARRLRMALGERADVPRYIETLPGRGYRFIAPVRAVPDRPGGASAPRHRAALHWAAAGLLISALCGSVGGRAPSWADRQAAATALSAYACALKAEGRVEEGLAVIERAHALAPESARFTAEVGLFLHAARRYDEEMPMLQRAVAQDRRSADAWLQLGLGFARRGDLAAAIEALDRAASLTADDPRPRQWLEWARAQRRDAVPARQS